MTVRGEDPEKRWARIGPGLHIAWLGVAALLVSTFSSWVEYPATSYRSRSSVGPIDWIHPKEVPNAVAIWMGIFEIVGALATLLCVTEMTAKPSLRGADRVIRAASGTAVAGFFFLYFLNIEQLAGPAIPVFFASMVCIVVGASFLKLALGLMPDQSQGADA